MIKEIVILVCNNCNTENEVNFLNDVTECGNCGKEISKESAGAIEFRQILSEA
jgi:hypothetical protein